MEVPVLAAVVAFLVVVLLVIVYLSIRVVQQYEKMVVFRLGRTNEKMVRDPGLRFLVPIIDRPVKVDVREQFIEVPSQTTITKDNAPINVDFLIYWRISDPLKSVVNVANFPGALQGVATTTSPRGHRRHPPRRGPVQARADQRGAPGQARRGDRALGRQGHHGRDPRDHAAARRPGRDEPAALRRAHAARRHHRVRRVRGRRRSTSPRARSSPRSSRPKASGRPRSCAPRASARRSPGSSRRPPASTRRRCRCSTSRRSRRSARDRPPSSSSRWSSPGCWIRSWTS